MTLEQMRQHVRTLRYRMRIAEENGLHAEASSIRAHLRAAERTLSGMESEAEVQTRAGARTADGGEPC